MNKKIKLSWTNLSNTEKYPCFYYNYSLMRMNTPETEYTKKGKECHKKLQNMKKLPNDLDFPLGEKHFMLTYGNYLLHGWADRVNYRSKALLEYKSVNKTLWTNSRMDQTMQMKYYSWISGFPHVFLLTSKFDMKKFSVFYRKFIQKDWQETENWAKNIIKIIETTDWRTFTCDGSCPFGVDCRIYLKYA